MICSRCNIENEPAAKFCKNCGCDLTFVPAPAQSESYIYFGIMALMMPIMLFLFRIHHKLFLLIGGKEDYYRIYDNFGYRITSIFLELIWLMLPVLIVIKVKNLALKIIVIILTAILFIFQFLSTFNIYNWNDFWYRP